MENHIIRILNQFFELEKKVHKLADARKLHRNLKRIHAAFEEMGYVLHDPLGEKYDETRTDCSANIIGTQHQDLIISEVIKPIIYLDQDGVKQIIQLGVVIAEGRRE
jgi:hypothetical protein